MSTATATKAKMIQVFALWKRTSEGGKTYFSGVSEDKKQSFTAFYNTDKKNLKEPDMRVYLRDSDGNIGKEPYCSLWCNATQKGKKYLSGKIDGKRVVGFINAEADEKHPYITVYWSDDQKVAADKSEAPKKQTKKVDSMPTAPKVEDDLDLPF